MKCRITRAINTFDSISPIYRVYEVKGDSEILRAGFGTEQLAREYAERLIKTPAAESETVVAEIEG